MHGWTNTDFALEDKEKAISAINLRLNEAIRVPEVRLINAKGENVGIVPIEEALRLAREAELDLVEIAPSATPPVCKITDIGKLLYERTKKEKEARKAQTKIEVKEIRLRPKTNEHHRSFKTRDARKWLQAGMKVRVTVRFRGREITYPDLALEDLREIAEELKDVCVVEQTPAMEGRSMSMVLGPAKIKHAKPAAGAKPEGEAPAAPESPSSQKEAAK